MIPALCCEGFVRAGMGSGKPVGVQCTSETLSSKAISLWFAGLTSETTSLRVVLEVGFIYILASDFSSIFLF